MQDISQGDVFAEGIGHYVQSEAFTGLNINDPHPGWKGAYSKLWDSLYGKKYPWKDNPFVWVVEFEKL